MCWMHHKKELKKRGSKPLTLLDEGFAYNVPTVYPLCRHCQEVFPRTSRYSENDALANEKNIIRCVTATLKPCLHAIDPEEINRIYKNQIKIILSKARSAAAVALWSEYTDQGVLHYHGWYCCNRSISGQLLSFLRRGGHILTKEPHDLQEWIEYCKKNQDENSIPPIRATS